MIKTFPYVKISCDNLGVLHSQKTLGKTLRVCCPYRTMSILILSGFLVVVSMYLVVTVAFARKDVS